MCKESRHGCPVNALREGPRQGKESEQKGREVDASVTKSTHVREFSIHPPLARALAPASTAERQSRSKVPSIMKPATTAPAKSAAELHTIVETTSGKVRGAVRGGIHQFKAIP